MMEVFSAAGMPDDRGFARPGSIVKEIFFNTYLLVDFAAKFTLSHSTLSGYLHRKFIGASVSFATSRLSRAS